MSWCFTDLFYQDCAHCLGAVQRQSLAWVRANEGAHKGPFKTKPMLMLSVSNKDTTARADIVK